MSGPVRSVQLRWTGEGLRFEGEGTEPRTPVVEIDGDNVRTPGPMMQLLLAAASCMASDVVLIVEKMRLGLKALAVDVTGQRAETDPKRYLSIVFHFRVEAQSPDEKQIRRAIELSLEKYCSVMHSLRRDIPIEYDLEVT